MNVSPAEGNDEYTNELVLITGGAGDIGSATAKLLALGGAHVVLADIDSDALTRIEGELRGCGIVQGARVDLTDAADTDRLIRDLERERGPFSILVNAAGMMDFRPFHEVTSVEWEAVVRTNLFAPVNAMRSVLPGMARRGRGIVINVCSIWSSRGGPDRSSYIAAKHALLGATRALSEEYRGTGVRINALSPGPVDTGMTRPLSSSEQRASWLKPTDVAEVLCFMCSQRAKAFVGSELQAFGDGLGPI